MSIGEDIGHRLRQLRLSLGFTRAAVVTLPVEIGADAAIFTRVQGILLNSFPISDPKEFCRSLRTE